MGYRLMGALHAHLHNRAGRLTAQAGQGTVEYVALILLIAVVLGAVVVAGKDMKDGGIAKAIVDKLRNSINTVGAGAGK